MCREEGGGTVVCVEGEVGESLSEEGGRNCRVCRGRGGGESVRGGGEELLCVEGEVGESLSEEGGGNCRVCRGRGR